MGENVRALGRGAWARSSISWLFSFVLLSFGIRTEPLNAQIGDPAQDQQGRLALAEAWAPVIFQDMASDSGAHFEPSDALVNLFFYDSKGVKENSDAIFRVPQREWANVFERPPVYYAIIESHTHYYINYFLYHALDTNVHWHSHDTENIWVILRKNGGNGELEGIVTNAHGRPMVYGVSPAMQKVSNQFKSKNRFLKFIDRNSKFHHQANGIEFVERPNSRSIKVFSTMRSHAIYKFSSQAPLSNATIYFPQNCSDCFDEIKGYRNQLIGYNLIDFDLVMDGVMRASKEGEALDSIFVRVEEDRVNASASYQDRGLPNYLAPSWSEQDPAANLFFVTSFKTPYTLADPAAVHAHLLQSSENISSDYIYNYYLEPVDSTVVQAQPPILFKHASVWGLASMLFDSNN